MIKTSLKMIYEQFLPLKVQFVIATHSPIVISSAEDAKLILMENPNKVRELPDAYGNNVGDVLELTQGSSEMPDEVKKW